MTGGRCLIFLLTPQLQVSGWKPRRVVESPAGSRGCGATPPDASSGPAADTGRGDSGWGIPRRGSGGDSLPIDSTPFPSKGRARESRAHRRGRSPSGPHTAGGPCDDLVGAAPGASKSNKGGATPQSVSMDVSMKKTPSRCGDSEAGGGDHDVVVSGVTASRPGPAGKEGARLEMRPHPPGFTASTAHPWQLVKIR